MHPPEPVVVRLQPSRLERNWIAGAAAATIVVATLSATAWLALAVAIVVVAWAVVRLRGNASIRAIHLDGDCTLVVTATGGCVTRGRVLPSTYVSGRVVALVWRGDGEIVARSFWVLPDMLPHDDFRRLRVLLRYGYSEPTHGAPASHA